MNKRASLGPSKALSPSSKSVLVNKKDVCVRFNLSEIQKKNLFYALLSLDEFIKKMLC